MNPFPCHNPCVKTMWPRVSGGSVTRGDKNGHESSHSKAPVMETGSCYFLITCGFTCTEIMIKKYWNDQFQVFTGEGMILRRQLTIDCSEKLSLSGVGFKDFLWLWPESLLLTSPPLVQKLLRNIWHRWNHSPILAVSHLLWLEWLAAVMISVTSDCLPQPGELGHSCSGTRRRSEAERRSLSHLPPPSTSHTTTTPLPLSHWSWQVSWSGVERGGTSLAALQRGATDLTVRAHSRPFERPPAPMQPLQEGIIWNKNTLHRSRPLLQERVRTDWQISSERPAPPLPLRGLPRNRFLLLILTHEPSLSAANLVLDMAQTSNVEKSKHRKDGKIQLVTASEQERFSHWTGKSENLLNFQFAETWMWCDELGELQWEIEYHQHHTKTEILKITIASTRYTEKTIK